MKEHEYEKCQLKAELEQLKRERESEKKSAWIVWFLAIWLLPLFGMELVQGDGPPATAGPISVWGTWFIGVPLVTFIYRKFMR